MPEAPWYENPMISGGLPAEVARWLANLGAQDQPQVQQLESGTPWAQTGPVPGIGPAPMTVSPGQGSGFGQQAPAIPTTTGTGAQVGWRGGDRGGGVAVGGGANPLGYGAPAPQPQLAPIQPLELQAGQGYQTQYPGLPTYEEYMAQAQAGGGGLTLPQGGGQTTASVGGVGGVGAGGAPAAAPWAGGQAGQYGQYPLPGVAAGEGVSPEQYQAFIQAHGGQTPMQYYGDPRTGTMLANPMFRYNRGAMTEENALGEYARDLRWSEAFAAKSGKPPTEEDWNEWWYQSRQRIHPRDLDRWKSRKEIKRMSSRDYRREMRKAEKGGDKARVRELRSARGRGGTGWYGLWRQGQMMPDSDLYNEFVQTYGTDPDTWYGGGGYGPPPLATGGGFPVAELTVIDDTAGRVPAGDRPVSVEAPGFEIPGAVEENYLAERNLGVPAPPAVSQTTPYNRPPQYVGPRTNWRI